MRLLFFIAAPLLAHAQSLEKDVQPIFRQYCYGCHAATVKMGSLDVQTHEGLMRGGNQGPIIVPGKAEESRLYLILTGRLEPQMPMGGKKLAAGELEIVKAWIDAGAKPDAGPPAQRSVKSISPRVPVKPAIYSLDWSSTMLATGEFKRVRILNATGGVLADWSGAVEAVRALAVSKDGTVVAAAGGLPAQKGELHILDPRKSRVIATANGHTDCIYAVAVSPDARMVATGSYDKMIYLWDARNATQIRPLKDHIDAVYALAFTPDGSRLISAGADRTVKVWNPATGERLYTLSESTDAVNAIAVSPDGKYVAGAGNDKTIRIWSLGERGGELKNTLIAHEDSILRLAWSPDGKTLASGSADRTVKMFRAADLTEIRTIPNQPEWISGLAFSPDGRRLAIARLDGSLDFTAID